MLRRVGHFLRRRKQCQQVRPSCRGEAYYPICWHRQPKNLRIARLFADAVRLWDDWRNRLTTWWLWSIESETDRWRKRPAVFLCRCLTPRIHDLRLRKRRHWLMLNEIEDLDCNRCADVQLNRCVNSGLLQGCFPTRDGFAADFHCSFIVLVGSVCSMVMIRLRA